MDTQSPIFVTGMPRSGTTLMQHLLSRHARIVIHGQEPKTVAWGEWLRTLKQGIAFAKTSNSQLAYECPHYAAETADPLETSTRFLTLISGYLTGGSPSPRWGVKSLSQCRKIAPQIQEVWPETRWIVCVRHPFRSFESLRNTFDRNGTYSPLELAQGWCKAVLFGLFHPQATLIQCDQLRTGEERHRKMAELFQFLEESYSPEVQQFVDQWPIVHKVIADEERSYRFSFEELEELQSRCHLISRLAEKLNYSLQVPE